MALGSPLCPAELAAATQRYLGYLPHPVLLAMWPLSVEHVAVCLRLHFIVKKHEALGPAQACSLQYWSSVLSARFCPRPANLPHLGMGRRMLPRKWFLWSNLGAEKNMWEKLRLSPRVDLLGTPEANWGDHLLFFSPVLLERKKKHDSGLYPLWQWWRADCVLKSGVSP